MPKAAADKKKSKARKTSSNPTRVFTLTAYGRLSAEQREALVPEFKLIEDQLFQAFLYRRTLVQVENRRRSRYHRLLLMISPLLRQHEERLQEIDEIIRKSRGFLKEKKKRTENHQQELLETWNQQLVPLLLEFNSFTGRTGLPELDWADPGKADVVQSLIVKYKTPARWQKAVQHLREAGNLDESPRDIGNLIKEASEDIEKEEKAEIMEALYQWAWPQIRRGSTAGLAEWYKAELLKRAFDA